MRRLAMVAAAASICAAAIADSALHIAVSKRVPVEGDTVRLAAYLDEWQAPSGETRVVFVAERDGVEQAIGKTVLGTRSEDPFGRSVEWHPDGNGLYRIIARTQDGQMEGRLFVPVVVQPVYFCFYGETRPEARWMTHHLAAAESEINALHAGGVMALKHAKGVHYLGGPRPEDIRTDIDFAELAEEMVRDYSQVDPWDGIAIDEWGMWDQHPQQEQLALALWPILKKAREAAPGKFFATWQFGSLTALECNLFRETMDIVMCEVYQNYFRAWFDQHRFYEYLQQRIDMARRLMVSKQTVMGLSIDTSYGGITPDELEDQIRYVRTHGPEMRGLSFFTTSRCEDEVLKRASDCCFRYWIKPAVALFTQADLTFSDYQPGHLGIVRVNATVHNVGGTDARNVRVRFWDGDPANGGQELGVRNIALLPAARWVDPEARDQASYDPPEAMRRDGFGMVTVSLDWKATYGPHQIWAEILPHADYTTLKAFESRRIQVR